MTLSDGCSGRAPRHPTQGACHGKRHPHQGDVVTVKSGEARHSSTLTVIGLHTDDTGQDCATLMWLDDLKDGPQECVLPLAFLEKTEPAALNRY